MGLAVTWVQRVMPCREATDAGLTEHHTNAAEVDNCTAVVIEWDGDGDPGVRSVSHAPNDVDVSSRTNPDVPII